MAGAKKAALPPLTKEEIAALFMAYKKTGETEIRNRLVTHFMYLPEIIARKFVNRGVDYEDLLQVASLALIKAVERFDPSFENEFPSFATPTIIGEIKRYFRDKNWVVRVPRRVQEFGQKVAHAKRELVQILQRVPTVEDIAAYTGLSEEDVLEAMEIGQAYSAYSLDHLLGQDSEDKPITLIDVLGAEDPEIKRVENVAALREALSSLDERKQKIIYYRYFLNMTQAKIAEKLAISQVHVSRLEKEGLRELLNYIK